MWSFLEDAHTFYGNIMPLNIKDLSIWDFHMSRGPGTNSYSYQLMTTLSILFLIYAHLRYSLIYTLSKLRKKFKITSRIIIRLYHYTKGYLIYSFLRESNQISTFSKEKFTAWSCKKWNQGKVGTAVLILFILK